MPEASVLAAVLVLGGVGLTLAALIAVCSRKLRVAEDPRVDAVAAMLPGANCGACGSAGCRNFAEKLVARSAQPAGCTVMNADMTAAVAGYLGVDAGTAVRRVARLLCAGGDDVTLRRAEYRGAPTCAAAASVASGGKACAWGCLGLGDCATACAFGAIAMSAEGLPVVDPAKCTACGDCVVACPKDLFVVLPATRRLLVQCRNRISGDAAAAGCAVACTACGRCVQDAAPGLVRIEDGLAVVDPARTELESPDATRRCPTGAIVWCEGRQFAQRGAACAGPRSAATTEAVPA